MAGKNLKYDSVDAKTRAKLDEFGATEWKKWVDFNAGVIVYGQRLLASSIHDGETGGIGTLCSKPYKPALASHLHLSLGWK